MIKIEEGAKLRVVYTDETDENAGIKAGDYCVSLEHSIAPFCRFEDKTKGYGGDGLWALTASQVEVVEE